MQVLDRTPRTRSQLHRNPALLPRLRERLEQQFMPHWENQWGGKCILHGRSPGLGFHPA